MAPEILVTGFSSISTGGPVRGLPPLAAPAEPQPIARWATPGPRRAFLVPPFRTTDFVPDLRTRRMDRLSAWVLLGGALALQDAGLDAGTLDRSRTALVFGTAYGCLDLTAEFLIAVAADASKAPPIVFPETLANLPGSHVARHFGITGPNLTVSAGLASGEAALLQAVGLLQAGDVDRALVVAGDTLMPALFEWYEAASLLAPACFGEPPAAPTPGPRTIVPGEGLAACLLETAPVAAARGARAHGRYHGGWLGREREAEGVLRRLLGEAAPEEVVLVAFRACGPSWMACLAERPGKPRLRAADGLECGEFGGSGLLQLGAALARLPEASHGFALVAGPADCQGQAGAILVSRPELP
jgi:hypothetical protein